MAKHKGIVRIDSDSTHGWQVRVYRNGKMYSKLFSDRKHGNREEALAQALRYRSSLEDEVERIEGPRRQRRRLVHEQKNNSSGVIGISRTYKRDRNGKRHEVFSVTWHPEPGRAKNTSFSIKKYGEKQALRKACKLRYEKMKEVYGRRYPVKSYMELYREALQQLTEFESATTDTAVSDTAQPQAPVVTPEPAAQNAPTAQA